MISVIIPSYKEVDNLRKLLPRLESLAKGQQVEILICIGKCKQDYSEVVKYCSKASIVKGDENGRAKQMNDGAKIAKGQAFVFLHADIIPPLGFFEDIKHVLKKKDAGFFTYIFDQTNLFLKFKGYYTKKDGIFTGAGDQCLFIKKSIFEKLGYFDEEQKIMEDFYFFRKMKKNKIPYSIVENDLIISSRKYKYNSHFKVNFTNFLLICMFYLGYPSDKLKKVHDSFIKMPYQKSKN